jgi:UDP-glucose 4-epimerase
MILITGGAGYGGSGLARELLSRGHEIRIIDIIAPNEARKLRGIVDKIDYRWKSVHDINVYDMNGVDTVIHMAAQADVPMGFTSPIWTVFEESMGTVALLEVCRRVPLKKVILASTGNVIGRPLYLPIDEKHPVTPHNPYSAAKASQELLANAYRLSYGVPTVIMRNGIVYGPNMRKNIFIYIWLKNIVEGKPIIIEGGEQTRDPCYGSDTVDVWSRIVEAPEDKVVGHTFQVSRGIEWSMLDIAKECIKAVGKEVPIVYADYRPGEKGQRECFSNEFAMNQLGYNPKVDLPDGLKLTLEWLLKEEGI